ncbi:L-threonylcarbamoyladenylate synthase [Methylobacter sp. YRD-M1]|uniref:L-threonylcarbamoyladenylate synthase n=1 Tax=Methylobacter sp. YRD-M1 TaxID=2911520 RepID=UPI00227D6346|nr:L-threonylcarbamoyladenylate synthase [Methylobacter sp. YRD-M1]WAK00389.1 threonylcarbamoyl-AMP synthase [Methylobacter sp. YRD-M1]
MKLVTADDSAIAEAAELLRQGGLVAFPTETVYGLGADAGNPAAVQRIFSAKGRPANHPLIVHIADMEKLEDWAYQVPESARKLAERFWPGPLAMVLKKKPSVPFAVTGGQETVALRVPNHPVALRLLRAFGSGIAAPSANRFKRISPTQAVHVAEELGDAVDLILDGGPCRIGVESTIIDLSGPRPVLLRPGQITRSQIEAVLQTELSILAQSGTRAPGMMTVHYAPTTIAMRCPAERFKETVQALLGQGRKVGLLSYSQTIAAHPEIHRLDLPARADGYAKSLYAALRELDRLQLDLILVEQPPETAEWQAINDRLRKATVPFQAWPPVPE